MIIKYMLRLHYPRTRTLPAPKIFPGWRFLHYFLCRKPVCSLTFDSYLFFINIWFCFLSLILNCIKHRMILFVIFCKNLSRVSQQIMSFTNFLYLFKQNIFNFCITSCGLVVNFEPIKNQANMADGGRGLNSTVLYCI